MQIFAKIIVSILIIALQIGGGIALVKVWRGDLDITKMLTKPFAFVESKKHVILPEPNFKIGIIPANYSSGLNVHNVVWSEDYRLYRFELSNKSNKTPMKDIRIEFEIPGGFVSRNVVIQTGVNDLTFSEDKLPAGITKGPGRGKMVATIPYYSNRLAISISEFNVQASLQIDFVIKIVGNIQNGYFSIRYSYSSPDGEMITERHLHPIIKLQKTDNLKIDNNTEITGEHQRSIAFIPDKSIVFKPDGSVEINGK
jgi:hypothetical protein